MKLYFIAGEHSGDYIGGKVIDAIKQQTGQQRDKIEFYGIGGPNMARQGINSLFDFREINLMGFVEILPHIFRLKKLINNTADDITSKKVDILVTIDAPGFTFRVAEKVRKIAPHIKLVHIVAPSVWAYNKDRAKKYARVYDLLLTLFPFEPPYFTKYGLATECIGHPILEQNFHDKSAEELKKELQVNEKAGARSARIIVITPGSRKGEITMHMPIITAALNMLSRAHKIIAIFVQSDDRYITYISRFLHEAKFNFHFSTERLKSFAICDVALAKSGTNTLEITASGKPMIIGYKLNYLTYAILKAFIQVKYANIINIIADREVIPEYIQSDFTPDNIAYALSELLTNPDKSVAQVNVATSVLKRLGLSDKQLPSQKAASSILALRAPGNLKVR